MRKILIVNILIFILINNANSSTDLMNFPSGVYLGVLLKNGGTLKQMQEFNKKSGRNHVAFAKFLRFPEDEFPFEWFNSVKQVNGVAHIILEPFGNFEDFFASNWGHTQNTYETVKQFAIKCANEKIPIFIRFAHEPNGWWYEWSPSYSNIDTITNETYIHGFRNFSKLVKEYAPNVRIVWAPNQGNGPGDLPYYTNTYPGDDVVDWVGLSIYNGEWYGNGNEVLDYQFKNGIEKGYWQYDTSITNDTNVNFYYEFSDTTNPNGHKKPMMVAETSSQFVPEYNIDNIILLSGFETINNLSKKSFFKQSIIINKNYGKTIFKRIEKKVFNISATSGLQWWDTTWGDVVWSKTTESSEGLYALKVSGTDNNNDLYIGGNGANIDFSISDLSVKNAFIFDAKSSGNEKIVPEIKITFIDNFNREAYVKTKISNNTYKTVIIPFDRITTVNNFNWKYVKFFKVEFFTSIAGESPDDLFIDNLYFANTNILNQNNNEKWKQDWLNQLYPIEDNNKEHPYYVNIQKYFSNIRMINWLHEEKFEDGETRDFRLVEENTLKTYNTYINKIFDTSYFKSLLPANRSQKVILTANPNSGEKPLNVNFIVNSLNNNILKYLWDFNNDGIYEIENNLNPFNYTFYDTGIYNVKVKLNFNDGLFIEDKSEIKVTQVLETSKKKSSCIISNLFDEKNILKINRLKDCFLSENKLIKIYYQYLCLQ